MKHLIVTFDSDKIENDNDFMSVCCIKPEPLLSTINVKNTTPIVHKLILKVSV